MPEHLSVLDFFQIFFSCVFGVVTEYCLRASLTEIYNRIAEYTQTSTNLISKPDVRSRHTRQVCFVPMHLTPELTIVIIFKFATLA